MEAAVGITDPKQVAAIPLRSKHTLQTMAHLSNRTQLVSIWNQIREAPGETPAAYAANLARACRVENLNLAAADIETLMQAFRIKNVPNAGHTRLLLTVLAGDQVLRTEEAYGVLAKGNPEGVTVSLIKRMLAIFGLEDAEAETIALQINQDGSGAITRSEFIAFLPAKFSRHPKAYHATHLGYSATHTIPQTETPAKAASTSATQAVPKANPANLEPETPAPSNDHQGSSPLQMQIGLFRLLQGAAYRSFRASYSANSETHLRAYDLPYTIGNFGQLVNAAVDLYSALGIVDATALGPLEELRSSVNGCLGDLQHRMEHWSELEISPAMQEAEDQLEQEFEALKHDHQLFAALVELVLATELEGHNPVNLTAEDLQRHELNRLRHLEEHRELSGHRHPPAQQSSRPFIDTWQRVIIDESDTTYAGALIPTAYWYNDFMPKLLRACSVRSKADIEALEQETEADLDAWFVKAREAGEFDTYASALKEHFLGCPHWVKQELRQAWRLTRHYMNGVQKRRERAEFGRGDGYISEYVAFVDLHIGRSDIANSEMRLSFPYYIGPATWRFLHTTAEVIAGMPKAQQLETVGLFKTFFKALATMYPCPYCRFHLNRYVVRNREVNLYPIEYLLLGPQDADNPHIEVTVDEKLSVINDGESLRMFVWKLHNTVSSSIARSEPWFHRDDQAHYTTRYWPSLDSELARAHALSIRIIETERVSRIYGVLKHAAHLGVLRDELQLALQRPGSEELRQVWERAQAVVIATEDAIVRSGFLQRSYHYNPALELEAPHFSPEEEALSRSGYYVEV